MTDEVEFIGTARVVSAMEGRAIVTDARVLIDTFPWWKRCVAWVLWRTPMQWFVSSRFQSPYALVRVMLRARSSVDATAEEPERAQAVDAPGA